MSFFQAAAQTNPLVVTTLAGLANFGAADGIDSVAKFLYPTGVAVDGTGNVYVADAYNDTIRLVATNGLVTTLAGSAQTTGSNDATGSAALFNHPYGVALDNSGNIFVADSYNSTIRKLATNGAVTTLAGMAGVSGFANASGTNALFSSPRGIAVDASGNIYVADSYNNMIRKIVNGSVTTLAGKLASGSSNGTGTNAQFSSPVALAVDGAGNVFVADSGNNLIRRITPAGVVTTVAGTGGTTFSSPSGIAVDSATNIYVADSGHEVVAKLTPSGTNWIVSTLAGVTGQSGDGDGGSPSGKFYDPFGVAVDGAGNVYIGDYSNGNVRKITPAGVVSTLGGPDGSYGLINGALAQARFNRPVGLALDAAGNLYVADELNNCIREVTAAGAVTILAGSTNGTNGSADGTNSSALFHAPAGLCLDAATNIYVADADNSTVRKITPDAAHSNWVTTTIAGRVGVFGFSNGIGTNTLFYIPSSVAVDSATNLYVADAYNDVIRVITPAGVVSTYAGNPTVAGYKDATGTNAQFDVPNGIAVDSSTNIYVADFINNAIRKIAPGGLVTTLTNGGILDYPEGVAVTGSNNVYVANTSANTILGIHISGTTVTATTIAGATNFAGCADGLGTAAQFDSPVGLAIDSSSNVYVADVYNNTIRKGTVYSTQTAVLTLATTPSGFALGVDGTNYSFTPQILAFPTNSAITATAVPPGGYALANWTTNGVVAGASSNLNFAIASNLTLVANFLPGDTVTLTASPNSGGTVGGGGIFVTNTQITVTAAPGAGYIFTNWTINGVVASTSSTYTFTVNSNVTLVANFVPVYTVTVSALPGAGGTVGGGGTFVSNSTIMVTATPGASYVFTNWTINGVVASSSSDYTFAVSSNVTLVANFVPVYTVTVSAFPGAGGTVAGGGTFVSNSIITVTAAAGNGYTFANWTTNGVLASTLSNYTFAVSRNVAVVANFVLIPPPFLSITRTNGTTILSWPSSANEFILESTTDIGTVAWMPVTNLPALVGSFFSVSNAWTNHSLMFRLHSQFLPIFTVSATPFPSGGGNVSGGGVFVSNSTVTMTATASGGYGFSNWTTNGNVASTSTNYAFTLTNNVTLVANFVPLASPLLYITRSNSVTYLSWPGSATGFVLESTMSLNTTNWAVVTNVPAHLGGFLTVSNAWPDQTRFFRLYAP